MANQNQEVIQPEVKKVPKTKEEDVALQSPVVTSPVELSQQSSSDFSSVKDSELKD